ncbi:MAG: aminotransferase class IV [Cyanobacteria bacterium P01_H01_bin.105]
MSYWFAGQLYEHDSISIAANNPALAYGASVFTTVRVYESSLEHPLTAWSKHCDRITKSLQTFDWPCPDWKRITQGCQALLIQYPVLRLSILADGRELITGRPLPTNLKQQQTEGITAWVARGPEYQRSLPGHKTGNYLPCWLAMQAAKAHQARDAILVTSTGEWLETSTGNLWGYVDGRWWTPPLSSGLLPGIIRARLLDSLGGQAINDIPWTFDVVKQFECLTYSNCVVTLMPIHTVLLGNIKLNYSSTHEGLTVLRQMFDSPSRCEHNC